MAGPSVSSVEWATVDAHELVGLELSPLVCAASICGHCQHVSDSVVTECVTVNMSVIVW